MIMLYVPSIFGESLMDDWFDGFDHMFGQLDRMDHRTDRKLYGKHASRMMKTDVREHEDSYELDMDLPGFKKEDLKLMLEDGYLTITAAKGVKEEDKDKESGKVIRQERYSGSMTRSFYVGTEVKEEDVKARFEDGVLKLIIPKKEAQKTVEEKKTIMIEG